MNIYYYKLAKSERGFAQRCVADIVEVKCKNKL